MVQPEAVLDGAQPRMAVLGIRVPQRNKRLDNLLWQADAVIGNSEQECLLLGFGTYSDHSRNCQIGNSVDDAILDEVDEHEFVDMAFHEICTDFLNDGEIGVAESLDNCIILNQFQFFAKRDVFALYVRQASQVAGQCARDGLDVFLAIDLGHPTNSIEGIVEQMGGQL